MQKIMLDVGLLEQERIVDAPARAGWAWLFLLRHCNVSANGGLISQAMSPGLLSRLLPPGIPMAEVIAARLVEDDGHGNWRVIGYELKAEDKYRAQSKAAIETNKKRWGTDRTEPTRLATNGSDNRLATRLPSVRKADRQTGRTPDSTPGRQDGGTEGRQDVREEGRGLYEQGLTELAQELAEGS